MFMLKSVFIYLVSTSINETRNAAHRFVPWEAQLDEARTMGGWGERDLKDLKEKREKFRLPSDPKESNKDTACILLWLLIIAEIGSV